MTPLLTVGQILSAQARLQPDRLGARDLERTMTYRAWNERACRLANGLLDLGLSKGDRASTSPMTGCLMRTDSAGTRMLIVHSRRSDHR